MCEVGRVAVETQHVAAAAVDDAQTALPERLSFFRQLHVAHWRLRRRTAASAADAGRNEKRFQRVADLVAHVRVGKIQTGKDERVQVAADTDVQQTRLGGVEFGADEQIDEDDVGRVHKGDVLPAL